MRRDPKVVVVHDYLTQRGGAERVALLFMRAFPDARLVTAAYDPASTWADFANYRVDPLWTNRVGAIRRNHRVGLPAYLAAFSAAKCEADVVICSSSGFAHGVRTSGSKLTYCFTPARWLYSEQAAYLAGWPRPVGMAVGGAGPLLRTWDQQRMRTSDRILTSSTAVKSRIRTAYDMDAQIVPPPAGLSPDGHRESVPGVAPGFLLSVGRLLAYKNVGCVVEAMRLVPDLQLVVAGDGPERARLEAAALPNVRMVGEVSDAQLRWLYSNASGVVSSAREDYGLTPLEAASFGKPTAALRFGGFVDTVIEGTTGVFFDQAAPESIAGALTLMSATNWSASRILEHGRSFSEESFIAQISYHVRSLAGQPTNRIEGSKLPSASVPATS